MAAAIDEPTKTAAQEAYSRDIYAASSHSVRDSHFNGWATLHGAWYGAHVPMLPLTVEKVHNVSSLFKEGTPASRSTSPGRQTHTSPRSTRAPMR